MAKITIVTDSNSGITQQEAEREGALVLPMPFLIDGEEFFEDVNLTQEQFYEKLKGDADVHTSQPAVGDVTEFWDNILKQCDEIVHIPMSSGLSQSCQTATALAKEYGGRVQVVDNHRISFTQRQSVRDAITLANRGLNAAEIKEELERTKLDSSIYIALDTLSYLKKGGRLTPAAALIGKIFRIKPVLTIQGEKLDAFKKVQTLRQAKDVMLTALAGDLYTRFADLTKAGKMAIGVAHSANEAEAEKFANELRVRFPDVPVSYIDPLSLSVSCHIGPGSLACGCVRVLD